MNRDLKHIDKVFHENLSDAADQPPAHLWSGIENALDVAGEIKSSGKKNKRKRFAFLFFFVVAAGLASIVWGLQDDQATVAEPISPERLRFSEANEPAFTRKERLPGSRTYDLPVSVEAGDKRPSRNTEKPGDQSSIQAYKNLNAGGASIQKVIEEQMVQPHPVQEVLRSASEAETTANEVTAEKLQSLRVADSSAGVDQNARQVDGSETAKIENGTPGFIPPVAPQVKVKKPGRFSVLLFFAPDITTRNLEQNFSTTHDERKEELMRTERNSEFDFTIGARIEYRLNRHFSLQSGLSFSTNTIDIAQKTVFARFDNRDGALKYRFNMSSGYAYFKPKTMAPPRFLGDSAQALSSTSTLHYVNIPLAVKYYVPLGRRFNLSVQAGITARFITRQNIDAVYTSNGFNEKGKTNEIQGLKTTYFNGVVGLGADYLVNSKIAFTVFPSFNFATSSINRDAPVKAYPNTLSLAAGIKYQF